MSQWDSRRDADLRGTHKPVPLIDSPSLFVREVAWSADLRTGRPPAMKRDRVEEMRRDRQDRALVKMMGHEI